MVMKIASHQLVWLQTEQHWLLVVGTILFVSGVNVSFECVVMCCIAELKMVTEGEKLKNKKAPNIVYGLPLS